MSYIYTVAGVIVGLVVIYSVELFARLWVYGVVEEQIADAIAKHKREEHDDV